MKNPATYRRAVAAVGLVLAAVLMTIAMGINVPFSGDPEEVLTEMDAAGGRAWLSAITYTLAQLALIPGVLGIAHLLRQRTPRLSNVGGTLAVLGAFGHTVHAGGVLLVVSMAQGTADRAALETALQEYQNSPVAIFSAMGLLGTVVGLILLTVGLWRAGVGPRWVPAALAAFLLVEFIGTAITVWATAAGSALYLASFGALALTIWRTPVGVWEVRSSTEAHQSEPV
ncbi:DUF4386 family protein [Ornithinicoccus halotolerans]|uniref:DUF4386 family protein n=1 Tax=Ornithinicoccus halotolerans TaxID=1748220 RepID=UPI0012948D14|nr:DUF4386 family protein [Ornithinicoccus halotolerans]